MQDLSTDVLCIYNALCKTTADVIEVKKDGDGYAVRRNPTKPVSLLRSKEETNEIKAKSVSVVSCTYFKIAANYTFFTERISSGCQI